MVNTIAYNLRFISVQVVHWLTYYIFHKMENEIQNFPDDTDLCLNTTHLNVVLGINILITMSPKFSYVS